MVAPTPITLNIATLTSLYNEVIPMIDYEIKQQLINLIDYIAQDVNADSAYGNSSIQYIDSDGLAVLRTFVQGLRTEED